MKTILCFGDSNLRAFIPGSFNEKTGLSARYTKDKRWPGIMQKMLGERYDVIEEGINGRTTNLDEILPGRPYRNGLKLFPASLESHYPIDIVIFMLGANDTKIQFNKTAEEITEGMRQLVCVAKESDKGSGESAPKIIILSPLPIIKVKNLHPQFDNEAIEKSKALASLYKKMSEQEKCEFVDVALIASASQIDGIHIEEEDQKLLASVLAEKVLQMS